MALGKLPGRLVSAAKGIAGGGYDKEPEGKKYDTADPRQAFWRGMSEDVSRVMMGQAPRGAAHGYAQDAIRYNEVGPERYAQRQILQGRAAQAERQGQQQEAAMQMWNQDPNGRQAGVPFATWIANQRPGRGDPRALGQVPPKDYTPESLQAFRQSELAGAPDYSLLEKPSTVEEIGGIKYDRNPVTGSLEPLIPIQDQIDTAADIEGAVADARKVSDRFAYLKEGASARAESVQNLTEILTAIESGELDTGIIEGRLALPSRYRELINAEQTKAARAALKASGEVRPTDADVKQMQEAMFGVTRTEEFNIHALRQAIERVKAEDREYGYERRRRGLIDEETPQRVRTYNPETGDFSE